MEGISLKYQQLLIIIAHQIVTNKNIDWLAASLSIEGFLKHR